MFQFKLEFEIFCCLCVGGKEGAHSLKRVKGKMYWCVYILFLLWLFISVKIVYIHFKYFFVSLRDVFFFHLHFSFAILSVFFLFNFVNLILNSANQSNFVIYLILGFFFHKLIYWSIIIIIMLVIFFLFVVCRIS